MQFSFAKVSGLIGPGASRKKKVNQLNLPATLKRSLMFQCNNQVFDDVTLTGSDDSDDSDENIYISRKMMYRGLI